MASAGQIRIQQSGYTEHLSELTESASNVQQIGSEFTQAIEQAAATWEGEGSDKWREFGERAKEAQDEMTKALNELQQMIGDVAQASDTGQTNQAQAVAQRAGSARVDEAIEALRLR